MNSIEVKHLTKIYHQNTKNAGIIEACKKLFLREVEYKIAVDDISFQVSSGDIVGLLGPNGAGKTTLLKMLSGILFPTSGEILVNGEIPYERKEVYKKNIAMVTGQRNQLVWDLSVIDTYEWLRVIYGLDRDTYKKNLDMLATIFHVEHLLKMQVKKLSLGQRMKVEFIASMIHCPKVLFLDEPTIGLDVIAQKELRDYIKIYNEETKATIILTSHNLTDVQELCNNIILINNGHITNNTSLQKLARVYCDYKIITLYNLVNEIDASNLPEGMELIKYSKQETIFKVMLVKLEEILPNIISDYCFEDINIRDADINSIIEKAFYELE